MFFLQQRNYKQYSDKQFLTHFRSVPYNSFFKSVKYPLVLLKELILNNVVGRMSLRSPLYKMLKAKHKAGITLEAALVLPLFIFFILNMFSAIEMLRLYGNIAFALNTVGGKISLYGYAYEQSGKEWDAGIIGDTIFTYLYVKEEMLDVLGEEYINQSPLVNGEEGIVFSKVKIMEDDLIELIVTYRMEMPFVMGNLGVVRTYNSYLSRAWTGYDVSAAAEQWVYIAENGQVYHTSSDCSYLALSVRKVKKALVTESINSEGKLYSPCELCGEKAENEVWITEDGEKYHGIEKCPGIKRTVYKVDKEDVIIQGYPECSRCGEK